MAQCMLLKSLPKAHLCSSCRPLTRPLSTWICKDAYSPTRPASCRASSYTGFCVPVPGHVSPAHCGANQFSRLALNIPQAAPADIVPQVPFEPTNPIKVTVSSGEVLAWQGDLLMLGVFEDDLNSDIKAEGGSASAETAPIPVETKWLETLDGQLNGALASIAAFGDFEGKMSSTSKVARVGGDSSIRYVALMGLGKRADLAKAGGNAFRATGRAITSLAKENRFSSVGVAFPTTTDVDVPLAAKEITAQVLRSAFESVRFKGTKSKKSKDFSAPKLQSVDILAAGRRLDGSEAAAVEAGKALGRGSLLAMYLVDGPPNACTPTHLAEAAAYLAEQHSSLKVEVLEKEQCKELGMGCYLGVAECSAEPPKFIHLTYTPPFGGAKKKIAVVGKGLTFDSGGYNLKVGASMIEIMKIDMGGAAATLGAAHIVGAMKPENVEIHFIIASCENMVDGKGLRPGDVLTAANGITVEVNNTDAEGRLTLADAMWFAQEKCGATSMVDAATLTGACIVALGTDLAGLFSPNDKLAEALITASKITGEKVWRMPMEGSYADGLKSSVADLKNTAGRWGGSITAALFLQEFVNEGVEWAHVDMAGPVWNEKAGSPTGFGAQLLAQWAISQSQA